MIHRRILREERKLRLLDRNAIPRRPSKRAADRLARRIDGRRGRAIAQAEKAGR